MESKLRRYIRAKHDPAAEMVRYLANLEKTIQDMTESALNKAILSARGNFEERVKELRDAIPKISESVALDVRRAVYANPDKFRGPKGKDGKTVVGPRGPAGASVQGPEGKSGRTPIAGIDYPSYKEIEKMVASSIPKQKDLMPMVEGLLKKIKILTPEEIARGIEALPKSKKLDYSTGLKNQPYIPKETGTRGAQIGGGGQKVEYYDLSALTDGVTKTFTIPANKRVLAVFGTDFPIVLRPVVDWTGSGTTTLTLTAEISAPQTGATLFILYIP